MDTTKLKLALKTKIRPHLHVPGVPFPIESFHSVCAVIIIFVEILHDSVEIYMDGFTPYKCDFEEAISDMCKVLKKCIEIVFH